MKRREFIRFTISSFLIPFAPFRFAYVRRPNEHIKYLDFVAVGKGRADLTINNVPFRSQSITSYKQNQYITYFDENLNLVLGKRALAESKWSLHKFPGIVAKPDSHNVGVMGISQDGTIHIAYNMHNDSLLYRRSLTPGDIAHLSPPLSMTGACEDSVTYPQFVHDPRTGRLFFFYRNGSAGKGSVFLNGYDVDTKQWEAVCRPLIDGQGATSPYLNTPVFDGNGRLHISWCFRLPADKSRMVRNENVCYAYSDDYGRNWRNAQEDLCRLPITYDTADVIDRVHPDGGMINQNGMDADSNGRPHLAYYKYDEKGVTQYYHTFLSDEGWRTSPFTRRASRVTLQGGGTLSLDLGRPTVVAGDGRVYVFYRDSELGDQLILYTAGHPYATWEHVQLGGPVGKWEGTYDQRLWSEKKIISIFYQNCHERFGIAPTSSEVSVLMLYPNPNPRS